MPIHTQDGLKRKPKRDIKAYNMAMKEQAKVQKLANKGYKDGTTTKRSNNEETFPHYRCHFSSLKSNSEEKCRR